MLPSSLSIHIILNISEWVIVWHIIHATYLNIVTTTVADLTLPLSHCCPHSFLCSPDVPLVEQKYGDGQRITIAPSHLSQYPHLVYPHLVTVGRLSL